MDKVRINHLRGAFDEIVQIVQDDKSGESIEFWYARELQLQLGYARWENFTTAIGRNW